MCCTCACNRGICIRGPGGSAGRCFLGRRRRWRGQRWWAARWRRRQGLRRGMRAGNGARHEGVRRRHSKACRLCAAQEQGLGGWVLSVRMEGVATTQCNGAHVADAVWLRVRGMCAARCTMVGRGVRALEAVLAAGSRGRSARPLSAMVGTLLFLFFRERFENKNGARQRLADSTPGEVAVALGIIAWF